jgi:hypothetical protein
MKEMQTPEMLQKLKDGPVGFLTLKASGVPNMGSSLGLWFAFNLFVAWAVACITAAALAGGGATSAKVFHTTAVVSFLTYAGGSVQNAIWMGKPWRSVSKDLLDALIYGAISGLVFSWLWPH